MTREYPQTDAEEAEKKRRQEEFMREQETHDRHRREGRRQIGTFLRFPKFCGDRRCKRARACAGNVDACFMQFWPAVPENIKNQIRQTVIFLNEGMTPREASAAAADYVAQRRRIAEATRRAKRSSLPRAARARADQDHARTSAGAFHRPAHPGDVMGGRLTFTTNDAVDVGRLSCNKCRS